MELLKKQLRLLTCFKNTMKTSQNHNLDYVNIVPTSGEHCHIKHKNNRSSGIRHKQNYAILHCAVHIIALSKELPTVFICLQEISGAFGPLICEQVKTLSKRFGNVFITATKSGKLQRQTYELEGQCNKAIREERYIYVNS
jgi:hypothetical protein